MSDFPWSYVLMNDLMTLQWYNLFNIQHLFDDNKLNVN